MMTLPAQSSGFVRTGRRYASFLAMAGMVLILAGCRDHGVQTVRVKGRITLGGSGWERPGLIFFTPAEPAPGFPRRGGMADFDENGDFVVQTFEPGDGLIPGRYVINLECWKVPPTMGGPAPVSLIPPKYQHGAQSGFEVTVSPDARGTVMVELDVPLGG